MTPKEKAKDLIDKMLNQQSFTEDLYDAKQCALIAVDEMIKQQQIQFDEMVWSCVGYWQEVKHEIEQL
jgi:hypothetical protein